MAVTKNQRDMFAHLSITNQLKNLLRDESISNQPIQFPMDRDGHDFHALIQYVLYMGTKLHRYRVIL